MYMHCAGAIMHIKHQLNQWTDKYRCTKVNYMASAHELSTQSIEPIGTDKQVTGHTKHWTNELTNRYYNSQLRRPFLIACTIHPHNVIVQAMRSVFLNQGRQVVWIIEAQKVTPHAYGRCIDSSSGMDTMELQLCRKYSGTPLKRTQLGPTIVSAIA